MSPWLIFALILVLAGLAGILAIVYKKIPMLLNLPNEAAPPKTWRERLNGLKKYPEAIKYFSYQPKVLEWLEKILRKTRLLILKTDNLFINWIARARDKSQVWTIRSRAWMEHRRLKKKEKTQMLEHLDKVEISQELEKMKQAAAKDEDIALKEKIENVKNGSPRLSSGEAGNGHHAEEKPEETAWSSNFPVSETNEAAIREKEKECIDAIAENPKDVENYRTLGFLYLNQKNYNDARACFRQILKINPEDEEIERKLEEINGLKNKNGAEKQEEKI